MDLEKQKLSPVAASLPPSAAVAAPASTEGALGETGTLSLGDCFDGFFWKIINDFCWSYKDSLSWEDFYNHINVKIYNFPYSQNVMNMLYNFITAKTDLLYSKLFPDFIKSQTCTGAFDIDFVLIRSILEEITSLGKNHYEAATADLVYNMYIYDKYTIPGGLCKVFTTFNNTKILRCEHIPNMADFSLDVAFGAFGAPDTRSAGGHFVATSFGGGREAATCVSSESEPE